jgi:hypothetical protein
MRAVNLGAVQSWETRQRAAKSMITARAKAGILAAMAKKT